MLAKIEYTINKIARSFLSPGMRRKISDFPLVLKFNEIVLGRQQVEVTTPERQVLKLNPLFHGHLSTTEAVLNHEPGVRNALIDRLKPGMVAYDIGANIGIFTLLMSHLVQQQGRVYAMEPEMNNYKHLLDSIEANGITNVIPLRIAVGETEATLQFDRRGGSFSGRVLDSDVHYTPTRNIITIPVKSVDSLVEGKLAAPPDLMKIDVEGFEGKVMLGMKEVISKYSPVIICEMHAHLGDPSEVVYETLSCAGYAVYELDAFLEGKHDKLAGLKDVHRIIALKDAA